ncbi:MBL fold metallo-hydrolase [Marinobacter salicampi]|uniref:MBL fold metallo-hydrolase n=1 Tax=Marinobacter salicampi TaxID=435907 RepID=UPI0030FE1BE0
MRSKRISSNERSCWSGTGLASAGPITSVIAMVCLAVGSASANTAGTVKVTPLGGQKGEFCRLDRALVFEDPNGTRILYDAGRTVAGPDDPRLADIDIVLVSHVHGDHIGDRHTKSPNAGTCANPDFSVDAMPHSSSVAIAVEKGAKIVTGSEMPSFFAAKLEKAGGKSEDSVLVRFGAMTEVGGVGITTVPATHSNGLAPGFLTGPLADYMTNSGITAYVGPPTGYVLKFSNGLVAYLSGDTGITAEQQVVVRDYYGASMAVMNIGDTFTTGPEEAAHVVNELIRPKSVIASHANEEATRDGEVLPGTRTEKFISAANMPVHVPLSGMTMEFDQAGSCSRGC